MSKLLAQISLNTCVVLKGLVHPKMLLSFTRSHFAFFQWKWMVTQSVTWPFCYMRDEKSHGFWDTVVSIEFLIKFLVDYTFSVLTSQHKRLWTLDQHQNKKSQPRLARLCTIVHFKAFHKKTVFSHTSCVLKDLLISGSSARSNEQSDSLWGA